MSATPSRATPSPKLWLAAALVLAITACATPSPAPEPGAQLSTPENMEANAQRLILEQAYEQAANQYAELARVTMEPVQSAHYRLMEAEILFAHQLDAQATARTDNLPQEMLTTELQSRRQLLQAAAELYRQQADLALLNLPDPRLIADPNLLLRYHELRYRAAAAMDESLPAFDSLIALDMLEDGANREQRNSQIWQLLNSRDAATLATFNNNASTGTHRGWLALLDTLRQVRERGLDYRSAITTWRQQYADHPANQMLSDYGGDLNSLLNAGAPAGDVSLIGSDAVALLLPFDARLAKFSEAIRDGLLSAHFENASSREIRIYDIGSNSADALPTYQRAVADGAQMVIGPLRRDALENLVRYGDLSVPLIALNYLPQGSADNLIQFGLSPEDEARDAVSYMVQSGLSSAAMILPDTEAGARSGRAFQTELERWGGRVVASEVLESGKSDYRKELSSLLRINESLQRRRNVQSELDTSLVFETHTRNDLDAIFAPVSPAIGRVLKPQLDFHGAGETPVLASSSIYSGSAQADRDNDLNGVLFNDMPWVIGPRLRSESPLHDTAKKLRLDTGPLARFFALGVDAYRITEQLETLLTNPQQTIEGTTGRLQLDEEHRVRRQLAWAVFENGVAKPISFDYGPVNPPQTQTRIEIEDRRSGATDF